MGLTFSRAVAAAMDGHTVQSWRALPPSDQVSLIYTEMRRIDAGSAKGWLVTGAEKKAA